MTWTAKFKVQYVSDGPAPTTVFARASVNDGTLMQNTEKAQSMELRIVLDVDETTIKTGDEITATGHFSADEK